MVGVTQRDGPAGRDPSRRTLLRGALGGALVLPLGVLTGCGLRLEDDVAPPVGPRRTAEPSATDLLARDEAVLSLALAQALVAAQTSAPAAVRAVLPALADQQRAHAAALLESAGAAGRAAAGAATATGTATTAPSPAPASVGVLVTRLTSAAAATRTGLRPGSRAGTTDDLARLLASVAAGRAVAAERLRSLGVRPLADPSPPATGAPGTSSAPTTTTAAPSTPTTAAEPTPDADRAEALDPALAATHAAVYALGVAGAWAAAADRTRVLDAYVWQVARREELADAARAAGREPEVADAAYDLPEPVRSPAAARRLAATTDVITATAWAQLVADGPLPLRVAAAQHLTDRAVSAAAWRGGPGPAFPGLPDRGWA